MEGKEVLRIWQISIILYTAIICQTKPKKVFGCRVQPKVNVVLSRGTGSYKTATRVRLL